LLQELLKIVEEATKRSFGSTLVEAQGLVPKGGALIVPIVTTAGGKILVLSHDEQGPKLAAIDLSSFSTDRLSDLTTSWIKAYAIQYLSDPERGQRLPEWLHAIETIGGQEWELFAGTLDAELRKQGVRPRARIIFLPTASLGVLPLKLAQDHRTGHRLGDTYEIVEAPSLEALAASSKQIATAPQRTLVAVVNPTGDNPALNLPFTEVEGSLVASDFPKPATTVLDKTTATPEAVLAALKDKSYWHISSHGYFDWNDARQSGLLMKDAKPLAAGILLDQQAALGHPRLVVLSACETGLYDTNRTPDEFVGLPATFMQLGAAGVVATLWQVDDLATALLMARFYDDHLKKGLSPPAALKEAQAWLRSSTRADLTAYARAAARAGRLDNLMALQLYGVLNSRGRSPDRRFAPVWDLVHNQGSLRSISSSSAALDEDNSRPFSHPYYWGAFVYTGL
jgi:CHAT domain-containing protein